MKSALLYLLVMLAPLLLARPAPAESLVRSGYQEAVFSVRDAGGYADFFGEVGGWERLHEGPVARELLRSWGLPEQASGFEIVVGNPGTTRGYVRLVQFLGVQQRQIRSNAQSWDTGGFFDVNARVLDMESQFVALQARDWQAASDPVQFSFGPFVVEEWLARGPDGIVLALIERIEPPLEGWPHLRQVSRLFNATQVVSDIEAAKHFYIEQLGFKVYLENRGTSTEPGLNVLGMPHNIATQAERVVYILHPDAVNEGSVELLQFEGLRGADFSAHAVPPNLGILMLRFPVADIDAFAALVKRENIEVAMQPTRVELAPYGHARLMAVRGPEGVWLEFFELE